MANCIRCNKIIEIKAYSKKRKFCSNPCRMKDYNSKVGKMKVYNLPAGTVGTISEMEVGLDLLKKGYEVYKPLTANCSGDLIIEKNKEFKKIEVKTGFRNQINGILNYNKKNIRAPIIAVVLIKTKEIIYLGDAANNL